MAARGGPSLAAATRRFVPAAASAGLQVLRAANLAGGSVGLSNAVAIDDLSP